MEFSSIKMRDVPKKERPRERLIQYEATHLSNQELLAILLASGTQKESVIDVTNKVLMKYDGLKLMGEATIEELTSIKGNGIAKGVTLLAALEIGKRIHQFKPDEGYIIRSPEDGADYVMEEMRSLKQEHL